MCDAQHKLSTASLLPGNSVTWIQLYFRIVLAAGNTSYLGLARSKCGKKPGPQPIDLPCLQLLPKSTALDVYLLPCCCCFKWKQDKKPLNCHVSKKGGSPLSLSAGNCFQPGCGNTTLCQEVVLDDTLKLPPFLLALQQSCTRLEEQNLPPSQEQKHRRV